MKALAPAADPLGSAAALIRCLKTPALSPAAKIDVALAAWAKEDLYIPAKRGLFMDWAVQTMSGAGAQAAKGKGKEKESTARCVPMSACPAERVCPGKLSRATSCSADRALSTVRASMLCR